MVNTMICLTGDDIQKKHPYALICETMEGVRWNTGRRRRSFSKAFTLTEQKRISEIKKKAHTWYLVKGAPDKVMIAYSTYLLWQRLAEFCASL